MVVVVGAGSHTARSIVIGALPSAWPAELGGGRGAFLPSPAGSHLCAVCVAHNT